MRALLVFVGVLGALSASALGGDGPVADLESPDASVRRTAARRLSETPDAAALGELIRALRREGDEETRRLIEIALGRIGDRRALWDLFRMLGRSDTTALWAIRRILDGEPPCPPDDRDQIEALDALGRSRALEWWDAQGYGRDRQPLSLPRPTPEEEPGLLRDLRSDDEGVALRAAERLVPHRLTLEELRIQATLLARHPQSWALQAIGRPIGTVDFPTLWKRLTESDLAVEDCQGRTHWAVLPDAIPVLADLLPEANDEWFDEFAGLLCWIARDTDRFRLDAARGFAYALLRIERERAGGERPTTDEIPDVRTQEGLPPAFRALVEHQVEMTGAPERDRNDPAAYLVSLPWLRRWARVLEPVEADLPFLVRIARGAKEVADQAWAVQAIGRVSGPTAAAELVRLANLETMVALFAAAERAKDGEADRFRELLETCAGEEVAEMLAFEVLPDVAIRRWIESASRLDPEDTWGSTPFDPGAPADLERIALYGVEVGEAMRSRLAAALPIGRIPVETLAWFLTEVSAAPLDGPGKEAVIERLEGFEAPMRESWAWNPESLVPLLALLEVRAPDQVIELLHHWVGDPDRGLRPLALELLARLDDSRYTPEILELWEGEGFPGFDDSRLGRLKDERVRAFLEERVRKGGKKADAAAEALAVWHGLPNHMAGWFSNYDRKLAAPDAIRESRERLLGGDALGGALLLTKSRTANPVHLGAVDDPRAIAALKRLRLDRTTYWQATAGLALAGDPDARREMAGLFRDGRTWIFYPLRGARAFTFDADPSWIDFWVERVDATCCIGFSALETLGPLFPGLCTQGVGCRAEVADLIRNWWRRNRDRLAWSRIRGGWIPR